MTITMGIETITPEIADKILSGNTHNRRVSQRIVNQYAKDLINNRWPINGEAIKIADDGTLLDGQHRLLAVRKTGLPVDTCVVRGLDITTQHTMDIGKSRSVRDALNIDGTPNSTGVAAIGNTLIRLKETSQLNDYRRLSLSNVEVQDFIAERPGIITSASYASATAGNPIQKSTIGTMHYLAHFVLGLGDEFDQFNAVLKTGVPTYEGDPAYHLREKIIRQRMSRMIYRPGDLLAMSLNAFEYFVNRKPCTKIYLKDAIEFTGLNPDKI